ncbi:hypothetical protein PN497_12430 [Sphaerospermopsis kisseleviana CS-549]|uniref:Transposase n=1 Tax=Sphaerospermopsis kisseleviana CS-549 TaxID=3021783 RepID=A0ABT4ZRW0_9CYAN|nr:hypothetical protein [Sphaerospermopsis kisseleviana]MDB9442161.1 hypothetical protein [Sphaerospermopsis kisseleviana CS-549]BAZ82400.1 hypothetical protein NIES73_36780 [Sphaerospermopsis kisseleviana NIES-73]
MTPEFELLVIDQTLNHSGLTQKETKVGVIHELPLRKNKVFSHILRKSYHCLWEAIFVVIYNLDTPKPSAIALNNGIVRLI